MQVRNVEVLSCVCGRPLPTVLYKVFIIFHFIQSFIFCIFFNCGISCVCRSNVNLYDYKVCTCKEVLVITKLSHSVFILRCCLNFKIYVRFKTHLYGVCKTSLQMKTRIRHVWVFAVLITQLIFKSKLLLYVVLCLYSNIF